VAGGSIVSGRKKDDPSQFELPLFPPQAAPASPTTSTSVARRLRVIQGEGRREVEKLGSRDAVVRVLLEAGADLLLRRISAERADEIERKVDRILRLFDQVDDQPVLMSVLQRQLDDLEALMRETRAQQPARRRSF
jgi:hypothetical protein